MSKTEPIDLRLARRAYEAYWNEQPQVWFEDITHAAQMRWVNAVRAVKAERQKASAAHARLVRWKLYTTKDGKPVRRYKNPPEVRRAWAQKKREQMKAKKEKENEGR